MTTSPSKQGQQVRVVVDQNPVPTSFEPWAKPGHFDRTLARGPQTTTWIWNLHADAHDFDSHSSDLQDISRKIFSAHFGHLAVVFLWLSGMYFHGARFSNFSSWMADPVHTKPSAQVVWPIFGQELLNADMGDGFRGIQITSGLFQMWRGEGFTHEFQLFWTAMGALVMAALMLFAGWFHYHVRAPKLEWFQNVQSMLNHHLAGLLGLGSLGWAGHLIHVAVPTNRLLDAGVPLGNIPLPHEFILNKALMAELYPSFVQGLAPFFTLNWSAYTDFLTFKGGLNPVTGGLWMTDIAHHHVAIAVLFIVAGHMYRTNWGIGHSIKVMLEDARTPKMLPFLSFIGPVGHRGLFEVLTTSWHAQLAINLAMLGSLSIIVAQHMYAMPPYPYLATDYATVTSLFTHHVWIGGFLIVGAAAHAAIFMVRDYDPAQNVNNVLDRTLRHRDAIISHLAWACQFLGFHSFAMYCHNDTMRAFGRPQDMFSDTGIQLQPIFAQWVQHVQTMAVGASLQAAEPLGNVFGGLRNIDLAGIGVTAPGLSGPVSHVFGGGVVAVGGKVAMMPIPLGTADFLIHHIHAFTIHVTVLVLLKGVLFARSSRLIPDKGELGFRFPCDGPGRGGTCQVSAWDHVFLGLFWMYNSLSIVIFHFFWKMQSDVWGTVNADGTIAHITGGNFAQSSITNNGWLRDFLWAQASQVIGSYGSALSAYGLLFLAGHFVFGFSLMFLFSGRGYWQELIESIVWAHNKLKITPAIQPRALSITQGRAVGVAHYLLGGIVTTWAFFLARMVAVG
ncbi:photosystem I core protein PsaA [Nodosilinea sp. LEGE 07298]|uniref:photosystem I core protein PsaA n=1 Tax=Nodosilinea sp. LEGE 07298 TaxID=2777970 RepID=UPI00187EFA25|nr:photosystem I core protein PsaA [Nodosilinea sp. LEGE 07298]MBE9111996.1 photosystem I core protein PsaA [Nodosilinea sp. LEGE 07298]